MASWSDASYNWPSGSDALTNDPRKCHVVSCHKKHAYIRNSKGRKIYSQFCTHHTCDRYDPEEHGYCTNPKTPSDRYCTVHLSCGEPGCDQLGQNLGLRDFVQWFCINHRCTAPDCRSRASEPQQQRCAAHFTKCSLPSCPRPAHLHRNGRLDLVCAVHYGTTPCLAPSCSRTTSASSRYCPVHKCAIDNCSSPRHASPPNSTACRVHLCVSPACANPVSYPDRKRSAHCARHTCRTPSCTNPHGVGEDFCNLHACATPGCAAEARFADAVSHCARHACVVSNCASPRLSADPSSRLGVGLEDRDRCAYHAGTRERRRAASFSGAGLDWEGLRGRFEARGEGKRLSDDVERLRRLARDRPGREGDFARYRWEDEEEVLEGMRRGGVSDEWRRKYPTGDDW